VKGIDWIPDSVANYAELVPQLVVTLSLNIIPPIVNLSVKFEGWDFENQKINQKVIRIFLVSIAQYVIFIIIQFSLLLNFSFVEERKEVSKFSCPEDELTINFV